MGFISTKVFRGANQETKDKEIYGNYNNKFRTMSNKFHTATKYSLHEMIKKEKRSRELKVNPAPPIDTDF